MNSFRRDIFLISYLFSYLPHTLGFILYVLPSNTFCNFVWSSWNGRSFSDCDFNFFDWHQSTRTSEIKMVFFHLNEKNLAFFILDFNRMFFWRSISTKTLFNLTCQSNVFLTSICNSAFFVLDFNRMLFWPEIITRCVLF